MSDEHGGEMKTVMVEVDVNNAEEFQDEYEISFQNKSGKMSDLQSIWKKLHSKNAVLRETAKKCDVVFKRKSLVKPGSWVVIGDDSPVKDGMQIRCCMKPSNLLISSLSQPGMYIKAMS